MNKYILFNISLLLVIASPNILNAQENGKWSNGHGDLSVNYQDSGWSFSFRHEDAVDDQTAVLNQSSKETIPEDLRFSFLGDAGSPIWIIPQVARPEILFLGMNAESTAKGAFEQGLFNLQLSSIHAPGDFFIWKSSLNEIDVDINSSDGITESDRMEFHARAHFHKNWGFNSPGTYRLGFTANGILANGVLPTESEEYFINFEVNVLSEGEVDLEIVYEDGEWEAEILAHVDGHGHDDHDEDDHGEDDHGEDDHGEAVYPANDVALRVDSRSATLVPNDPAFGFLGHPGELFYELPQHEEEGLLYLGIASDEVEAGVFVGDQVQLNLKSAEGPGEVYLYSTDTFGKPNVMFNTADGISESDTFVMKAGAHSHQSMAFSEAGLYRVAFDFSGKLAGTGEETRSEEFQLLFEVEKGTPSGLTDDHGEDDHYSIKSFSRAASPFSLTLQTKDGMNYIIEASHDLKKWGEIGEIQGTGSPVNFIEARKALFPRQYYRVKIKE